MSVCQINISELNWSLYCVSNEATSTKNTSLSCDDQIRAIWRYILARTVYRLLWRKISLQRFVAVGAHIAPADVIQELNEMPKVYQDIQTKLHEENVVVMGRFKCHCRYLDQSEELELLLKKDPRFTWHIERGVDTTTEENTFCAYDRILQLAQFLIMFFLLKPKFTMSLKYSGSMQTQLTSSVITIP